MSNKEIITKANIADYLPFLTNEEIYGCIGGRLSIIGIREDGRAEPTGFCIAEILPEYIRLHRFFVNETQDAKRIAKELLDVLRDLPAENRLPVYLFDIKGQRILKELGFLPCNGSYYYETTKLSDMKQLILKKKKGMTVHFAEDIPEEKLLPGLHLAKMDRFFQFPYGDLDTETFAGSLICRIHGEIAAYILMEEGDSYLRIPYLYGRDSESLDACFFILKNILEKEYDPNIRLVFLTTSKSGALPLSRYFQSIHKFPVRLWKLD